ncbi:MAG: TRAP transporter small permease subunit [Deltaproteobacteria bacterium]|nr:TRAP transporter small permease subunit [Deltaproteobacteria bacterium]
MRVLKWITYINEKVGLLCGWIILVMTISVTFDVVMRYFFNRPTYWGLELNLYLLVATSFLAGGYCLLVDGHVRVDIIYQIFPPRMRALVDVVTSALFFLFVAVIVWKGWEFAYESLVEGKRSSDAMGWPLYPSQMMIPIGGVLIGLQGVVKLIEDIVILVKGELPE